MASGSRTEQGTLTKGARITGDQRSSLAKSYGSRYASGESIRSIAQDTGRSYGFVHGVLKESGASLRGRGGATRGARPGPVQQAAARVEEVVEAAVDGVAATVRSKAKTLKDAEKTGRSKGKNAKESKAKDVKAKKQVEAKKPAKKAKSGKKG